MTDLPVPAGFSGVLSVSAGDDIVFERAYGHADRAHGIAAQVDTQFAIASGSKAFTALVVMNLVADSTLTLRSTARALLGTDLPLIADDVTVEHLLGHTSGIGDYLDEDLPEEPPLKVPVQALVTTADFLPALDGFPTKFRAGTRFSYCNAGYVLLALLAERASRRSFHDLVRDRVLDAAGMSGTAFPRSDALPGSAAIGYLPDGRTNVFDLPVVGNGDGGAYTTAADLRRFWSALFAGTLVPADVVSAMTTPRHTDPGSGNRYGLGFWLVGDTVTLFGADHGVRFASSHDPATGRTASLLSNSELPTPGLWPALRAEAFGMTAFGAAQLPPS